ncbi:class I SAM-dependent methyltransferase [Rariglobus hedericola]|uniref:Class I SAM-dependent methyltransferase n=1 Tax=Rariglobus hedericola TaxID=2597822 RepID=A0A556QJF4_9BACT|nr:class I SAM-dependent methyltransferase [Rariglobus hedericola]TSJ76784.1 class I SAM-dependent methyltransferase [Rariglobus hedericola]
MNSLLIPSVSVSSVSPSFELSSVAFFGRSLAEYAKFFPLDVAALRGRAVLDVAAGPSAFTAEATRCGIRATAVDPLYGCSPETLSAHVRLDYARTLRQMRAKPEIFRLKSFASLDEAERERRTAAEIFLADYEAGFLDNRYVGGALPRLPFADGAFDVVLCAHLLFIYERLFDYAFHLAACRELVRVSRDEVRIHPVCGPDGKPYRELGRLRADLAREGIASSVVSVDYEFFRGSDTTLVLRRVARNGLLAL